MVFRCLVCGFGQDEVNKMHRFPTNLDKSRIWQEAMAMVFTGESLKNYRICSRHFASEAYKNVMFVLKKDAVPTLFPAIQYMPNVKLAEAEPQLTTSTTPITTEDVSKPSTSSTLIATQTVVDTSAASSRVPTLSKRQRSLFKEIEGLTGSTVSPRKKALVKIIRKKEDYLRKLKGECKRRAKNIKQLCTMDNTALVRNLFKDMRSETQQFLISQLRCAKRQPKGRRWTLDEKIVALALHKRSPKCYGLLRKFVALPSRRTLSSLLEKIQFETGINRNLFEHINQCLGSHKDEDRICLIAFDEMDIKEHIQFDTAADCIRGYENGDSTRRFAKKALVFMAQGLRRKWKQPLAFYFFSGNCPPETLTTLLPEVINASMNIAKLDVIATVCDMGTNNVKALKDMGSSVGKPYIEYNGKKVFTVFDPPHLLKCTASLFRKHTISLPINLGSENVVMEAKFSDIVEAYKIDQEAPLHFRSMYKLKHTHLNPDMRSTMKVKIAAQLLSRTVAAFIFSLLSKGNLPQRSIATATLVQQIDELFDSFNGNSRSAPDGKEVHSWISEESPHVAYWQNMFKTVTNWYFRRITKTGQVRKGMPPSQIGWLTSIRAILGIWNLVKSRGFSYLRPRSLNQDGLENLFGAIRSGCGCNENPTASQFITSLKTQIINGLTNNNLQGSNCEEDDAFILSNLRSFIGANAVSETEWGVESLDPEVINEATPVSEDSEKIANDIVAAVSDGNVETLSVAYVSGYIAKSIIKDINCAECFTALTGQTDLPCNIFIHFKEFSAEKCKLHYPSENLVVAVGHAITELEVILSNASDYKNICKKSVSHLINAVQFTFLCEIHHDFVKESIIKGVCKIGIPWYCKRENEQRRQLRSDVRGTQRKTAKLRNV